MNRLKHQLIVAVIAAAASIGGFSQAQAAVYTWSRHNLTFETPDGGWVTYNSNTRFEIRWDEMVMTVQLYEKRDGDTKIVEDNLRRKAADFNMYDTKVEKIKVSGFDAKCISGTMPDGSRGLIADLVSKKSHIIAEITVNYLMGNREMVEDMVKSFAENKKQQPHREKHKQKVQKKSDADREQRREQKPKPAAKPKAEKYFDV